MVPEERSGDYPLETTAMSVHDVIVENIIKVNGYSLMDILCTGI